MKILIADDDPQILRALHVTLRARGYEAIGVTNGVQAINAAIEHKPALYLLDLGMPQMNGLEVITAIRGWSDAPILVVSGRTESRDKVEALDAGADDYIVKPFAIDELLARIRALTRRTPAAPSTPLVYFGTTEVDLSAKKATRRGETGPENVRLTPTEWQFLELLIKNKGNLVTRQMILTEIWGSEHVTDTGYLRLYISQLRRKLEPDPQNPKFLLTESGMGYRFNEGA